MQLKELRRQVRLRGWKLAGEYVDTGWSGSKASRPQLDRLMADARSRTLDVILVWKLDRWGRSVSNVLDSLNELRSLGVRWIATTQNLDTDETNPNGRLMLIILSAVAEFERAMIQERVKAGVKAAMAKGVRFGRPKKIFDRGKAVQMRADGVSFRGIARELGVPLAAVQRAVSACASNPRQSRVSKASPKRGPKVTQGKH